MKKILVLMTGGTIGSSLNIGVISVKTDSCRAVELYRARYDDGIELHTQVIMNILSENLDKCHWQDITGHILSADLSEYCGIIITHGSDTLSYSSAMLGFCLCGLGIPVVLTAADLVPDLPESNAVDDIRGAVAVIKCMNCGVYTVYRNPGENDCAVYLATRVSEADRVRGCFSSFDGMPFAYVRDGRLEFSGSVAPENVPVSIRPLKFAQPLSLNNDVLMIRPYPGMNISDIHIGERVKAVLYITYHSSSACADGRGSVLRLLSQCREKGTELFLASFPRNSAMYETSCALIENGAVPLTHISDEAAYTKLLLAVNLDVPDIRRFMDKDIFLETIC